MGTKKEKKEVATKPVAKTKSKTAPKREAIQPAAKAAVRPAAKTVKKPAVKTVQSNGVNKTDIEVRAYYISLERRIAGSKPDPIADWLEAERQMLS